MCRAWNQRSRLYLQRQINGVESSIWLQYCKKQFLQWLQRLSDIKNKKLVVRVRTNAMSFFIVVNWLTSNCLLYAVNWSKGTFKKHASKMKTAELHDRIEIFIIQRCELLENEHRWDAWIEHIFNITFFKKSLQGLFFCHKIAQIICAESLTKTQRLCEKSAYKNRLCEIFTYNDSTRKDARLCTTCRL